MTDERRRWDTDERFAGVADAGSLAESLERLVDACRRPRWVAEDAAAHLGGHLEAAAPALGFRWAGGAQDATGVYVADLVTELPETRAYRRAVALLAVVAESSFAVRRVDRRTVECVTGMLEGDGEFAAHGHTVRLHIRPEGET